jgi:hypothetical protein
MIIALKFLMSAFDLMLIFKMDAGCSPPNPEQV